jgi:hypothetical protein
MRLLSLEHPAAGWQQRFMLNSNADSTFAHPAKLYVLMHRQQCMLQGNTN